MCSAFTLDYGYDNSIIIFTGDAYSPNTKRSGKLCVNKKTFQSLGRSDYQYPQCAFVCQDRNNSFEGQTISFFVSFGQGVYIFEEGSKSIQDVIGDVYCPGKYCSNRGKFECLGVYVTTPRPFLWLWKLWILIVCSQSSFYVTGARENDKNRQNTFSLR